MSNKSDRTFISGIPNPWECGLIPIRACNGVEPDQEQVVHAARLLGREPFFTDGTGFECEIFAATIHPDGKRIVYVESRAKKRKRRVDIAIKIHYVDFDGQNNAIDIESYNPFFGCDVSLIEWFNDEVAILVYREKHWTFVYRVDDTWPPKFKKIEDRWQIKGGVLSYMEYEADNVHRLAVPSLASMPDVAITEADSLDQLPPDPYAS